MSIPEFLAWRCAGCGARATGYAAGAAAKVVERWSLPTIQAPSMWLVDKAGIAEAIRAMKGPAR